MPKGRVRNFSQKNLWVIETDSGSAVAHKLSPGKQSPSSIDADGVKAIDGTPIDSHSSWWKIELDGGFGFVDSDVKDSGDSLAISCGGFCTRRNETEFGDITFDRSDNWGEDI